MRERHFQELRPVCPVCRHANEGILAPLLLSHVAEQQDDQIVQAVLVCSRAECQREYPIIDGIPLLIPTIRDYLTSQLIPLGFRDDLAPVLESVVGDCCGPGSAWDVVRQQVSAYVWDHYGEFDRETAMASGAADSPGSIIRLLCALLDVRQAAGAGTLGRCLDVGCGPGRTTFELAARSDDLVLGIDLNFGLLRAASRVLRHGRVRFGRRQVGLVYERREFEVSFPQANRVDFWCCDAAALPFASQTFATALALNVLDSTSSPLALLGSLADTLVASGTLALACPYDWSAAVTPVEQWLGGHSQRGPDQGDSRALVRRVLEQSVTPSGERLWEVLAERDAVPWVVRQHARSATHYDVHLLVARLGSALVARTDA